MSYAARAAAMGSNLNRSSEEIRRERREVLLSELADKRRELRRVKEEVEALERALNKCG